MSTTYPHHVMAAEDELVVADVSHDIQKLICLEFPGIVNNEADAIEKLGGKSALSQGHFEGRRLEVRFRPDDQYCKPATSKTSIGSILILKVKRHRTKVGLQKESHKLGRSPETDTNEIQYSAELMGICNRSYQFSGMADYQALPPGLNDLLYKGKRVDPNDFQMKEPLDSGFSNRDIPSFLPPTCFSKCDKPISYTYRPHLKSVRPTSSEDSITALPQRGTKLKKVNLAYSLTFESVGIPKEPNPDAVESINHNNPLIPLIKVMFEERPIWTKAAIQWRIKATQLRVRSVLPLIAYNFLTGPYKRLWVKFGYDPRTDPASKIYQSMDFRVPRDFNIVESHSYGELSLSESVDNGEEVNFIFFPDKLPKHRFVYYQLCDIRDPECQLLIHKNDGKESVCSEVNGWCEENTYDRLRKLITLRMKSLQNVSDE